MAHSDMIESEEEMSAGGDEEKVELDLRSSAKAPSGEHSMMKESQKSGSEPMEKKNLDHLDDDDGGDLISDAEMDSRNSSFERRQAEQHIHINN